MGNCQAIDAAALVVQHPSGKIERFYWPMTASEVMKMHPGHYVSLIIPLQEEENHQEQKTVRFTRVKILKASETLALGHAYRLVTSEDVMKVLWAKKFARMKKEQLQSVEKMQLPQEKPSKSCRDNPILRVDKSNQKAIDGKQRPRKARGTSMRSRSWCPSLQSISEGGVDPGFFTHSEIAD